LVEQWTEKTLHENITADNSNTSTGGVDSLPVNLLANLKNDPEFLAVATAWPSLPADVRRAIVGVVKATMEANKARR